MFTNQIQYLGQVLFFNDVMGMVARPVVPRIEQNGAPTFSKHSDVAH